MFQPIKICPSILSANFMEMGKCVNELEEAGAGFMHVDVMDGHFVPNLTMGVPVVAQLKKHTRVPLDVHLMISNPLDQLQWYLDAGADMVSVHAETLDAAGMKAAIDRIHASGVLAAVAIKPATPVSAVAPVISDLDMVLVMSVEPGFSGQSYIEGSQDKVAEVVSLARSVGREDILVQVDGGIGPLTAPLVSAQGADLLVCGNAVVAADDPAFALANIRNIADEARIAAL